DLAALSANDGTHLAKLAVSYSDAVIFAEGLAESEVAKYASELGLVSVTSPQISAEDSGYISVYNKLYDQILGADVSEEAL
ncbi:MAG: hypothetical protein HUJ90_07285, partial [Bacteroidales bacterium]|nr:hypothetical protein [Bacteroidales bacterium]